MLNATGTRIEDTKIKPEHLAGLIALIENNTLSGPSAKTVFEEMFHSGKAAKEIVAEKGLSQISDSTELDSIVTQVIDSNSQAVSDFNAGKEQSLAFLIGQVMKATKGRANPTIAKEILLQKLGGNRDV